MTTNTVDCTRLKYDRDEKAYIKLESELYTGKCECFHSNGVKAIENNYRQGLLHGKAYMWHSNGQLQLDSQYEDGERVGIFRTYFENGKIETETEYQGQVIVRARKYKSNGEVELDFKIK